MSSLKYIKHLSLFVFSFLVLQVSPLVGQEVHWGTGTIDDPFIVDADNDGFHTWGSAKYGTSGQTLYYKLTHDCTILPGQLTIEENGESKTVRVHSFVVGENVQVFFNLNGYELKLSNTESYTENDRAMFTVKTGGTLTLQSVDANGNVLDGGAIVGVDGRVDSEHYSRRACIDVGDNATVNFNSGTIRDFIRATGIEWENELGAAIYVGSGATVNLQGGKIYNCGFDLSKYDGVASHYGGAIYITTNGVVNFSAGTIENCYAYEGGGVYVNNSAGTIEGRGLVMSGSAKITGCIAYHNGGGVHVESAGGSSGLKLASTGTNGVGCEISYNRSGTFGCGVYVEGPFDMEGGKIHHNYPYRTSLWSEYPTAIDMLVQEPYDNNYPHGGAVYLSHASMTMNGGRIENNIAASGGGVMLSDASTLVLNGTDAEMSGNYAVGCWGTGNGGAVYVDKGSTFNFINGELSGNKARRYGGAININEGASLSLTGSCKIELNEAGHGGGISQEAGQCNMSLQNSGVQIIGNKALGCWLRYKDVDPYTYSEGNGGGIFIEMGTVNMSAGKIYNNAANGSGGGISLRSERLSDDITFNLSGTAIIEGNTANADKSNEGTEESMNVVGNGGGIDISGVPKDGSKSISIECNITGGELKDNKADNGGAINVYVDKATNPNNRATVNIDVADNAAVIKSNAAAVNGGGVMLENGNVVITKGSVSGNSARNGGGIAVKNGNVVITGINSMIDKNSATEKGGGLYVFNTAATSAGSTQISFSGGNIVENKSVEGLGGGICVDGFVNLTTTGTNVKNNEAKNGGGIYLSGGASMIFNGGLICNNKAEGTVAEGYTTAYQNDANNAGVGGGIYLASNSTLKFFNEGVTPSAFGVYGNAAATAADDIFATGSSTSIQLPKVSGMSLAGFDVPTTELYWVEDYVVQDTKYTNGTKVNVSYTDGSESILRYRYALRNFRDINKISFQESEAAKIYESYVCLALGYEQYYVNLLKKGLKRDDSAIFKVSYLKNGNYIPYRTVLFHRTTESDTEGVKASVVLTAGNWKFEEDTAWSGKKYKLSGVSSNLPEGYASYLTSSDKDFTVTIGSDVYTQLRKENKNTFEFTITNTSDGKVLPPSAESAVTNRIPTAVAN